MKLVVPLDVSREDVELLSETIEKYPEDEQLMLFISRILKRTNNIAKSIGKAAFDILEVNPYSVCIFNGKGRGGNA